jgi:hypothetical protein
MLSARRPAPIAWKWSISKSHLLYSCPRAFELSTVLRGSGAASEARFSLRALSGVAIHQTISQELDKWALRERLTPLAAVQRAENFIDDIWSERRNRLTEAINGFEPDVRVVQSIKSATRSRLERFFSTLWPQFAGYRHLN